MVSISLASWHGDFGYDVHVKHPHGWGGKDSGWTHLYDNHKKHGWGHHGWGHHGWGHKKHHGWGHKKHHGWGWH